MQISGSHCALKTQCVQPACRAPIELTVDNKGRGRCPLCAQIMSPKEPEVAHYLERKAADPALAGRSRLFASGNGFCCVLEDIRSLYNVGSMFRTADGAGVGELVLVGISGCPPHKQIAKTSLGAEDTVPWNYAKNALPVLRQAREMGAHVIGLEYLRDDPDFGQSQPLTSLLSGGDLADPTGRIVLVVGNEVSGLSAEALSACHAIAHLPMHGVKESLNVAVAFGIAVYRIAEAREHLGL